MMNLSESDRRALKFGGIGVVGILLFMLVGAPLMEYWDRLNGDVTRAEGKLRSIETGLSDTEAANRALLEAIPDALLRIRRDGTYIDFIPAKNSQTPISASKFLGKKISEVLPPELSLKVSADVEAAFSRVWGTPEPR